MLKEKKVIHKRDLFLGNESQGRGQYRIVGGAKGSKFSLLKMFFDSACFP